jgi:hypothetical protein
MAPAVLLPNVAANTEPVGAGTRNNQELISMAENLSILEFLQKMIDNTSLRDWFARDPQGALAHYGLQDVSPEDVRDAIVLADDSQTADFSRSYDTGFHGSLPGGNGHHIAGRTDHDTEHHSSGHSSGHQEAVEHLSRYVTNNFVDDRDTNVDDSVNQQIHTHGGDVDQFIRTDSTTASGDGAVAAHGDILGSQVTTGDGNQIGDGNIKGDNNVQGDGNQVVHGDGNTTAFGSGAANSADLHNVNVSDGGALSVAGPANGFQDTTDSHDHTSLTTTDTTHIEDSGNLHADSTTDSNNDLRESTSTDSHDHTHNDIDSHNHVDVPVV